MDPDANLLSDAMLSLIGDMKDFVKSGNCCFLVGKSDVNNSYFLNERYLKQCDYEYLIIVSSTFFFVYTFCMFVKFVFFVAMQAYVN